jgi:membrane peptidoglycan carboxypeptidase
VAQNKILSRIFKSIMILALLITGSGAAIMGYILYKSKDLPTSQSLRDYALPRTTSVILDGKNKNGKGINTQKALIGYDTCYMENLPREDFSEMMKLITINSEDARFYQHQGVDFIAIPSAIMSNLAAGRTVRGASTLRIQVAEQYLRQVSDKYRKSNKFDQKILEMIVAFFKLHGDQFEDDDIVYLYNQIVPVHRGMCGIEAYAQQMLGKPAREMTVGELVLYNSLFPGPSIYDPIKYPDDAKKRRDINALSILRNAEKNKTMTKQQLDQVRAVLNEPLPKTKIPNYTSIGTDSWASYTIKSELNQTKFPSEYINKGYTIKSTIDNQIQALLERKAKEWKRAGHFGKDYRIGILVIDPVNYSVLGALGSKDPYEPTNSWSNSSDEDKQIGSAGKIKLYANYWQSTLDYAKKNGFKPNTSTINASNGGMKVSGPIGPLNFIEGFAASTNTLAIGALLKTIVLNNKSITGSSILINSYADLGIKFPTNPKKYGYVSPKDNTVALGTFNLTLPGLAAGVASVVSGNKVNRLGIAQTPITTIKEIYDHEGKLIYDYRDSPKAKVYDPQVTEIMLKAMRASVTSGTSKAANVPGLTVYGKTGTHEDKLVLFVGYAKVNGKDVLIVMRVSREKNKAIGDGVFGGTVCAPRVAEIFEGIKDLNLK